MNETVQLANRRNVADVIPGDFITTIQAGDLDGDGDIDLVAQLGRQLFWYANDGQGNFEPGGVIADISASGSMSLLDFDLDGDMDIVIGEIWHEQRQTGDVNDDGLFNSTDLVLLFQNNQYEDHITGNAEFDDGDWNADGEFDSKDLVIAFQSGNYQANARMNRMRFGFVDGEDPRFEPIMFGHAYRPI